MALKLRIAGGDSTPLYRRIADAVCAAVVDGKVAPGGKLPAHMGLARQLGVSPLTVSRGYEWLKSQGIVRQRRGSGTYVEADALDRLAGSTRRTFENLYIVVGESTLAACRRETFFIIANKFDGVHSVIPPRQTAQVTVCSLTREDLPTVGENDAVLLMAPRHVDAGYAHELMGRGVPMVIVGNDDMPRVAPTVTYDRTHAVGLACRHLLDLGYRRIGFIGRKTFLEQSISPKYAVFMSLLHEAGLDISGRHVRESDIAPGRAYAAARDILAGGDLPEAFFVDTDYKAMEVIAALRDAGVRVPEDVAIVGYDNVPESEEFDPPLTTISTPRRQMGQQAARMLVDWPRDGSVPQDVVLQSELIVRASCGSLLVAGAAASSA